jgi:molybdopterin/thiamine biosynthesis adenylyltransferase/nitroreductase
VSPPSSDETRCNATILDATDADHRRLLEELRADPAIEFVDRCDDQASTLTRLRPPPDPELTAEPRRWAYYPWRRAVIGILGPCAFRRVRLDRNRNLISAEEQGQLSSLRVGVIGLSVGHAIAHALATQGLCGQLLLADFDDLELSNLNRVPATVFDIGLNKAVAAARRIAEIDPYLDVRVMSSGLTPDHVDEFLDGLDVVVEECDSLDMKALVREAARVRRQPVLMATSDRGMVDVERFDLEPQRPIFHGLLGEVDTAKLAGLTNREKIPHVLRIIDAGSLSARGAASLIEVGYTLSTWPQLAGDVALGATAVAEAVRRIGLGETLSSGRVRIDVGAALDGLADPAEQRVDLHLDPEWPDDHVHVEPSDVVGAVVAAAIRAPSGGNAQPWLIEAARDAVVVRLAAEHKSTMDVGYRGSAVAVGAAVFNARVAAAAKGVLGPVEFTESDGQSPLQATIGLTGDGDPDLARLYPAMTRRQTNRHHGTPAGLSADTVELLQSTASQEGARLELLTAREDIERAAELLAAADRIRYLTPRLHADMASELRWPGEGSLDSGIDVRSLELDPGELLTLDILRRPDVMSMLAEWDTGGALGADTRTRIGASSALAVVIARGRTLTDYARSGSAAEAVWIKAQERGLAVQPISPVFLYAHGDDELHQLSPTFVTALRDLQSDFRRLARTGPDEAQVLALRLADAPPTSVRSRRRWPGRARPPLP